MPSIDDILSYLVLHFCTLFAGDFVIFVKSGFNWGVALLIKFL